MASPASLALGVAVRHLAGKRRHLPGQHDQQKHAGGAGAGEPSTYKMKIGGKWTTVHAQTPAVYPEGDKKAAQAAWKADYEAVEGKKAAAALFADPGDPADAKRAAARAVAARLEGVPARDCAQAAIDLESIGTGGQGYLERRGFENVWVAMNDPEALARGDRVALVSSRTNAGTEKQYYMMIAKDAPSTGEMLTPGHYGLRILDSGPLGGPEGDRIIREAACASIIDRWARTSNDHDSASLAIQGAVREEFGLNQAADWPLGNGTVTFPAYETHTFLRRYARASYDATQADLAARGITHLTVYRGAGASLISDEVAEAATLSALSASPQPVAIPRTTVALRPLSSFSASQATAGTFSYDAAGDDDGIGAVARTTVPASSVFSTPFTGAGCLDEEEVILLGEPVDLQVVKVDVMTDEGSIVSVGVQGA